MLKHLLRTAFIISLFGALLIPAAGCKPESRTPAELIDRFFTSAIRQDYSAAYDCYYGAYKAKVSRKDYVKHRRDASMLQSYEVLSLKQEGDSARAEVLLTWAPSEKLKREKPVSVKVTEEMVREGSGWKIKVWG